ncbi:hypothetical protein SHL15_9164 [Streptomyces hygroscopicus subsp. limoneus]|nr:hypothetical protein SHL15_9164 [Streptomyces hygroscopicus subsp. limoneus]
MLIVMGGLPGTGKTTLARLLAEAKRPESSTASVILASRSVSLDAVNTDAPSVTSERTSSRASVTVSATCTVKPLARRASAARSGCAASAGFAKVSSPAGP